jgi:hypothetical protein
MPHLRRAEGCSDLRTLAIAGAAAATAPRFHLQVCSGLSGCGARAWQQEALLPDAARSALLHAVPGIEQDARVHTIVQPRLT